MTCRGCRFPVGPSANTSRVRSAGWRLTMNLSAAAICASEDSRAEDSRAEESRADDSRARGIATTMFIVRPVRWVVRQIPVCPHVSSPAPAPAPSPSNPTRISLTVAVTLPG
jgi:hypothetical protein